MAKVAIVTDSSACLPAQVLRANDILTVPLTFLFDGEVHYDGSLSGRRFYHLLRASRGFPTTASPAPAAFLAAFRQAARSADAVLCVTLPSTFSGTYSSARNAADIARDELPGLPIRIIDSHCLAMSHGFAVLSAARAAAASADLDEAEAVVRDIASRAYLIGVLDTLRFLAKSGRVPIVMHWATSLLQIKPILVAEGEDVQALERVRTMPRALRRLLRRLEERVGGVRPLHMAVMHADAPALAERLASVLRERFRPDELLTAEFTSVMGAHTGPGFVGVSFFSGAPSPSLRPKAAGGTAEADASVLESSLTEVPPPGPSPALVLVCGLPGSGKSYFSERLRDRYPLAHLNSDALRKVLFPEPDHGAAESARLFAAIHVVLERLLRRGVGAILDATSLKEEHRLPLYELAGRCGARLAVVQTEAPREVVRQRLTGRARRPDPGDASDASLAVYDRMGRDAEPIQRHHIRVDTSGDIEPGIEAVLRELAVANSV